MYQFYEEGRDLLITFLGNNYDVPQLEVVQTDSLDKITGAYTPSFASETFYPYTPTTLFYQQIPYEFLYTEVKTPQLQVTVDGLEAVCASLDCGYTYVAATSSITSYSLSSTTLTIVGVDLVSTNIRLVSFSNRPCTNVATNAAKTQLTCTVTPVSGQWMPIVFDFQGKIPSTTTDKITVPLSLTSISPSTGINPWGGNIFTIIGTNLPQDLQDGTEFSLQFADGTDCNIQSVKSEMVVCVSEKFASNTLTTVLIVSLNGFQDSTTLSITLTNEPATITEVSPA